MNTNAISMDMEFVKDIWQNPEDTRLKLIYADWMEEYDSEESARLRDDKIHEVSLWYGDYCKGKLKNGFIYSLEIEYRDFIRHTKEIFNDVRIALTEVNINVYEILAHDILTNSHYYRMYHVLEIVPYLTGRNMHGLYVDYVDGDDAIKDLNQACLLYGRSLIQ